MGTDRTLVILKAVLLCSQPPFSRTTISCLNLELPTSPTETWKSRPLASINHYMHLPFLSASFLVLISTVILRPKLKNVPGFSCHNPKALLLLHPRVLCGQVTCRSVFCVLLGTSWAPWRDSGAATDSSGTTVLFFLLFFFFPLASYLSQPFGLAPFFPRHVSKHSSLNDVLLHLRHPPSSLLSTLEAAPLASS